MTCFGENHAVTPLQFLAFEMTPDPRDNVTLTLSQQVSLPCAAHQHFGKKKVNKKKNKQP